MLNGMVLGEEIGKVSYSWLPFYFDVTLFNPVACPVKAHVNGLGMFLFHGIVGEADSTGVVANDWRGLWLRVPEIGECIPEAFDFFGNGK